MNTDEIRAGIPVTDQYLYFNTGGISPATRAVTECLVQEAKDIAQHGPPVLMDNTGHHERLQAARQRIANFCGVEASDLCLTHGVADGVTTVFNGLDFQAGDELILTDEEHPAVKMPAQRLADDLGGPGRADEAR